MLDCIFALSGSIFLSAAWMKAPKSWLSNLKNDGELKGRANMLYDGIKSQNDSDKAEHTSMK